jgi:predicted RNA methylase
MLEVQQLGEKVENVIQPIKKPIKPDPKRQGLKILFGDDWHKWTYLQNQLSYVTPCTISMKVAQLAHHYYGNTKSRVSAIWDMFGGIGMDSIHLSKFFKSVVVTEIDPEVFLVLQQNIMHICDPLTEQTKFILLNEDALPKIRDKKFMENLRVVFFDPPWGNSFKAGEPFDFAKIAITTTTVNGKPYEQNIMSLLDKLYNVIPNIIVKSPILSDSFEKWAIKKGAVILQMCEFPNQKLKYLFLGRK